MIPADRLDLTYGSNRTVRIGGQGHNETITVTSSNTTGILDYFFFQKCGLPREHVIIRRRTKRKKKRGRKKSKQNRGQNV